MKKQPISTGKLSRNKIIHRWFIWQRKQLNKEEMFAIVHEQLAVDLNCNVADLTSEKAEFIFIEAKEKDGAELFLEGYSILKC